MPVKTHISGKTIKVTFSDPLAESTVTALDRFAMRVWALERSKNYGSKHIDEHDLLVEKAELSDDRHTVILTIPELAPTWCYELRCRLQPEGGPSVERIIHGTVHETE